MVRYAAPAFHTVGELEIAQLEGAVLKRSGHVAPSAFGTHQVWTYQSGGGHGLPNPDGEQTTFDTFDDLFEMVDVLNQPETLDAAGQLDVPTDQRLRRHLATLADACRYRDPTLRALLDEWTPRLSTVDLDPLSIGALADYATVQTLAARQHIAWWITG